MSCPRLEPFKETSHLFSPGKWEWLSDSPSLLPPCDGAVSYYSQFGATIGFTSHAGRRFRGVLDEHLNLLRWPQGMEVSIFSVIE